jgi:hypothetical protein
MNAGRSFVSGERNMGQAFYKCHISIVGSDTGHRAPLEEKEISTSRFPFVPCRQAISSPLYNPARHIGDSVLALDAHILLRSDMSSWSFVSCGRTGRALA